MQPAGSSRIPDRRGESGMRALRRSEKGQATVEMALVLPILIWLLVGLLDVARMANIYLSIGHAAREAVRIGATGASDSQIINRALQTAPSLESDRVTITVSPASPRYSGSDVTVTVDYRYQIMAMMGLAGSEMPLRAVLTGRVE